MTESEDNDNIPEKAPTEEVNLEEVNRYLTITDDEYLNLMATPPSTSGSQDSMRLSRHVDNAFLESIGGAKRIRKQIVARMNTNTLSILAERLFDPDELFKYANISGGQHSFEGIEDDPVRGPVFEMLLKKNLLPKPKDVVTDERIERAWGREPPDLPCTLETALLWMTEASKALLPTIHRAFNDWTISVLAELDTEALRTQIVDLNKLIKSPETDTIQLEVLRAKLESDKRWKSTLRKARSYRRSFIAGTSRPVKSLNESIQKHKDSHLGIPPMVRCKIHLLQFCDFTLFWRNHAMTYEANAKKKSDINRKSGLLGPTSRMTKDWLARTDEFIGFCIERTIPRIGSDEWNQFLQEFSDTQKGDRRTRKKITNFMGIHLAAQERLPLTYELIKSLIVQLKAAGIKAINEHTIRHVMERFQSIAER
jgi:hypothetical protein